MQYTALTGALPAGEVGLSVLSLSFEIAHLRTGTV
jgi:hypothetical protein